MKLRKFLSIIWMIYANIVGGLVFIIVSCYLLIHVVPEFFCQCGFFSDDACYNQDGPREYFQNDGKWCSKK